MVLLLLLLLGISTSLKALPQPDEIRETIGGIEKSLKAFPDNDTIHPKKEEFYGYFYDIPIAINSTIDLFEVFLI